MKNKVMKLVFPAFLASMIALTFSCATGDDNEIADISNSFSEDTEIQTGTFEGEWTVNKQVVDTARLVVNEYGVMNVRLPEIYLLGLCFPDLMTGSISSSSDKIGNFSVVPDNMPYTVNYYPQGYSEQSQYMTFVSENIKDEDGKQLFDIKGFKATINGMPSIVSLQSYENATAVLQMATGQWTLGITIDRIVVKNLSTGESTYYKMPVTVSLYYNTKKRIA